MITSKQRAWLRGQANTIKPLLQIGKDGFSQETVRHADDLLRTRELVKIAVQKAAEETPRELADLLSDKLGAEVVSVLGRKIVLYRHSKQLAEKGRSLILPRA